MYSPARGLLYHPRNKNLSLGALTEAIYYSQVQGGEPRPSFWTSLGASWSTAPPAASARPCARQDRLCGNALQIRSFLEYKGKGGHPIKTALLTHLAEDPAGRLPKVAKVLSLGQAAANSVLGLVPATSASGLKARSCKAPARSSTCATSPRSSSSRSVPSSACPRPPLTTPCSTSPVRGGALQPRHRPGGRVPALEGRGERGAAGTAPVLRLSAAFQRLHRGLQRNRHRTIQEILDTLISTGRAGLKAPRSSPAAAPAASRWRPTTSARSSRSP